MSETMRESMSAAAQGVLLALDELQRRRTELRRELGDVEAEIKQCENALQALNGGGRTRHNRSGVVVLAALATFDKPVTTGTLCKHPDLVHYAEPTLRRALTDLHRRGLIVSVERSPKGHLWSAR